MSMAAATAPASRKITAAGIGSAYNLLSFAYSAYFGGLHPVRARFGRFHVWALTGPKAPGVFSTHPPGWGGRAAGKPIIITYWGKNWGIEDFTMLIHGYK